MPGISQNTCAHLKYLAETYNKLLRQEKYRQTDVVEETFVSFDKALAALQLQGFEIHIIKCVVKPRD